MIKELDFAWLREPVKKDDTWARTGEAPLDWLSRSTLPRAKDARRFLNFNLSKLPTCLAKSLCDTFKFKWQSAFFELVVARTLQEVGAKVEVEVETESGSKPDFLAWFGEEGIVVEVTSPEFLRKFDEHNQRHISPLIEIIEKLVPRGWSVFVKELPHIRPCDSKREFKGVVTRLLTVEPPRSDNESKNIREEICDGVIRLTLMAKGKRHATIIGEPVFTYRGNAVSKIRRAVKRKRAQVRSSDHPRFLAIDTRFGANFSDFDLALFGDGSGIVGEFIRKGESEPVFAGVLAFPEVGFTCPYEPILYMHPRFSGRFPIELSVFERRVMKSDGQIVKHPALNRVLDALCPVDPSL